MTSSRSNTDLVNLPASKNQELDQDVAVLKQIFSETIEKSVVFQQQLREQMKIQNKSGKAVLQIIQKAVDFQQLVFFNPREFIEKSFDEDRRVDLAKLREVRGVVTQLAINIDKVIFKLFSTDYSSLSNQLSLLGHLFDGVGEHAAQQKRNLNELRRKIQKLPSAAPPSPSAMIESLSKARILCMFYIKWLTLADNDYTDKEIAKSDDKLKREFGQKLTSNLDTISMTNNQAFLDVFVAKLSAIELKLDRLTQENTSAHELIVNDVNILKDMCVTLAQQYSEETKKYIESKTAELVILLQTIEDSLQTKSPSNARIARNWKKRLERGIGISADLIQLLTFLTGLASLSALSGSPAATSIVEFLKHLASGLRK